jgi:hypothetical protein
MGFIASFKAKRAAKRAQAIYELEIYEWDRENKVLAEALEIFEGAAKGVELEDNSLVQKKGELVLWAGTGIYHEAGRTPSRYVGGSSGFSIPIVAGIRYRVGSFKGQVVPGEEMQMDKDQGMVKITNQRLIFTGPISTAEWSYAKLLSTFSNPERNDFIFGVSNRKKSSGLKFSSEDGYAFAHLFALALYTYENGLPETIKNIKSELKESESKKPKLVLPTITPKEIKG